jgi:hypothetical protein
MLRRQKAWPIPAYWREGRLVDLLHAGVKFRSSSLGANPAFTGRSLCLPHCIDSEWERVMRASYANEANHLRERATEMRGSSKELKNHDTAAFIMRLADLYDRLAVREEARGDHAVPLEGHN